MNQASRISQISSVPRSRQNSLLAALLVAGPLILVARLLITHTHHRPLGAVTFGFVAVCAWVLAEFFVRQGLSEGEPLALAAVSSQKSGRPAARPEYLRGAVWILAALSTLAALLFSLVLAP